MTSTPRVGDTVHYTAHGTPHRPDGSQAHPSVCRAAIVTAISSPHPGAEPSVTLTVLTPTGMHSNTVPYHGGRPLPDGAQCEATGLFHDPGTWHHREPAPEGWQPLGAVTPARTGNKVRVAEGKAFIAPFAKTTTFRTDDAAPEALDALFHGRPVEDIARVTHEANRAWQIATGDPAPSPHWEDAEEWQRASVINGVRNALAGQTPRQLHISWCEEKSAAGWVYGKKKSYTAKTHPCLVPYDQLPADQRAKDTLFHAIVRALR